MNEPKVGQFLWSSCAGESYGQILEVGLDGNKTPVISILLKNVADISWADEDSVDFPNPDLHFVEIPKETPVILRDVQYVIRPWHKDSTLIECRTPGNGCYRCTKLFRLMDKEGNPYA